MKKVFISFVAFVAMAIAFVSCTKLDDDGNRTLNVKGTIVGDYLVDDSGARMSLTGNTIPDRTRGIFSVTYNVNNVKTDGSGTVVVEGVTATLQAKILVKSMESVQEAEAKGVDITKLDKNISLQYCDLLGGYMQLLAYDLYENNDSYHIVYDPAVQKNDTLKLKLCNDGKPTTKTHAMQVDFDFENVRNLMPWKDTLVVSLEVTGIKKVNMKMLKSAMKKPY